LENKVLYLSELALGILAKAQKHDVYIPHNDVYINAEITDLYKELFSLTSKGILEISEESGLLKICDDFAPALKNIFNANMLITVNDCSLISNRMYYFASSGITELSFNENRKKYRVTLLNNPDFVNCIQEFLRLPASYNNDHSETELFIDLMEKNIDRNKQAFSTEYLNMSIDEIVSSADNITSVIDLFSCRTSKVVSRIMICQCSVYYKIVKVTSDKVNVVNYNFNAFEDMIGESIGEFYDHN